ncbi:MAG TPA: multicopper oxidase domain-containing protein [Anaeromyxobacteraceae bacterium]|nr:multicopper oxidase domain-containing protein [Anaeromyxobacteraceae bacterium]
MYLPWNASRRRRREAEQARQERLEMVAARSRGGVTRRDLVRWGLLTAAGSVVLRNGLSPFAPSAYADGSIPTGVPRSPVPPGLEFTQALPRLQVLSPVPVSALSPTPTERANTAPRTVNPPGPVEGRPPGPDWAHQRFQEFFPSVAYDIHTRPATGVRFHPALPVQQANRVWAFNGTFPPKLIRARYGEPILMRNHNDLPVDAAANAGFGRNEVSTHLHNGHTPAESDGFTGAFFFPGEFYDYHWVNVLAGHDTINTGATDPRAGGPDNGTGIVRVAGDWRETMSSLWFHDHRFSFTSQNVYKGLAATLNLYSALDRGNEALADGVNLRLPSGTALGFGNLDYDVNLVFGDKALDRDGQLVFDIFDTNGFLGDVMVVNGAYKPFLEVERRKYRFRLLNGGPARFYKFALSDSSPFQQIGNDGNLMARPVQLTQLDELGVAERYDIVVDFSRYPVGTKLWLVNLAEHEDGRRVARDLSVAQALSGGSSDPGVGKILEFRVARDPAQPDRSQVPAALIPLPDRVATVRQRDFVFGDQGNDRDPWTINGLTADPNRISALPRPGTAEIWRLHNDGGDWDHPIHIHFEECQTIARSGGLPATEAGARKDVWRLHPDGSVTVFLQFREFFGMYMEHCHNTTHEDHAMLLRWELDKGPQPLPTPMPTPSGVTFIDPKVVQGA